MALLTKVLSYLAAFGLGFIACLFYFRLHPPPAKAPVTAVFSQGSGDRELAKYGIQNGDLLKSVNGITDETMLKELVNGYSRGDVCVILERQEQTHEICIKRKSAGASR